MGIWGGMEGGCSVDTTLLFPSSSPLDPTEPGGGTQLHTQYSMTILNTQ